MQPVAERGGSDQALLRLVRSLPPGEFDFHIALPARPRSPPSSPPPARPSTSSRCTGSRPATARPTGRPTPRAGRRPWPGSPASPGDSTSTSCTRTRSTPGTDGRRRGSWADPMSCTRARSSCSRARRCASSARCAGGSRPASIAVSYAVAAQLDPANVVVLDEFLDPDEFAPARAGRFRTPDRPARRRPHHRRGRPPRPAEGSRRAPRRVRPRCASPGPGPSW